MSEPTGGEEFRTADREARRAAYAARERRRAAAALDRFLAVLYGTPDEVWTDAARVENDRFVEAVGDYVLARIGERGACPLGRADG